MKIQCNVCEAAEAVVLCCADEAALCFNCDQKVHAANKLASKHQRVPLSCSSSEIPKCDICQETAGYFFCVEDRALLCRKCDVAIHSVNSLVSVHQRFLLTGVKVGLEANEAHPASSLGKKTPNKAEKILELKPNSSPKRTTPLLSTNQYDKSGLIEASVCGDVPLSKLPSMGGISNGSVPLWQFDEFIGLSDFTQNYNFMSNGSSKADSGRLGDSDCSQIIRPGDAEFEGDDCLGQVPETFWAVPEISSPPTASGLCWPKNFQNPSDTAVFVPDITSQNFQHQDQWHITNSKRRRYF